MFLLAAKAKLDNHLDDNAYPAVRGISDRKMTDQPRSSEGPNEPGHSRSNAEARICKQSWTSTQCLSCVWSDRTLAQCPGRPVNVIELEDEVQEFEPSQDAGMRHILSVQVDVSDVRLLRPSTLLVLFVNSMDVWSKTPIARGDQQTDVSAASNAAGEPIQTSERGHAPHCDGVACTRPFDTTGKQTTSRESSMINEQAIDWWS